MMMSVIIEFVVPSHEGFLVVVSVLPMYGHAEKEEEDGPHSPNAEE